jgi:hypothetical protein
MKAKLEKFRSSDIQVTPGEKEAVDKQYERNLKEYSKRKRLVS